MNDEMGASESVVTLLDIDIRRRYIVKLPNRCVDHSAASIRDTWLVVFYVKHLAKPTKLVERCFPSVKLQLGYN